MIVHYLNPHLVGRSGLEDKDFILVASFQPPIPFDLIILHQNRCTVVITKQNTFCRPQTFFTCLPYYKFGLARVIIIK